MAVGGLNDVSERYGKVPILPPVKVKPSQGDAGARQTKWGLTAIFARIHLDRSNPAPIVNDERNVQEVAGQVQQIDVLSNIKKSLDTDPRLDAISLAMGGSIVPRAVYKLIGQYMVESHAEKLQKYFLQHCYSRQWDLQSVEGRDQALKAFTAFVVKEAIDLNQISRIELSGLHCVGSEDPTFWCASHLEPNPNYERSSCLIDQVMTAVFAILPKLREVVAHRTPGFANSFFSLKPTYQEMRESQLETVDLSYNLDINVRAFQRFCERIPRFYPKLRTLILTGCGFSDELQGFARRYVSVVCL